MPQDSLSTSEPAEYTPLPSGGRETPEWRAARELDERAQDADGRLKLGCCMFWLSDGGYLLMALPPVGDVRGSGSWIKIYTAEHLVAIQGNNLHLLAWAMKQQQVDDLRVTPATDEAENPDEWVITAIKAEERGDE